LNAENNKKKKNDGFEIKSSSLKRKFDNESSFLNKKNFEDKFDIELNEIKKNSETMNNYLEEFFFDLTVTIQYFKKSSNENNINNKNNSFSNFFCGCDMIKNSDDENKNKKKEFCAVIWNILFIEKI
jgi:hypothetical protein